MLENELLLRLLTALGVIALSVGSWLLLNRWMLWRARRNTLPNTAPGVRKILYFTTPTCVPCKTFQRPALQQVKQTLGDHLEIIEIDASAQPDLARQWNVLSVPTTFILDATGQPRHINHGPTSAAKLLQQLENA